MAQFRYRALDARGNDAAGSVEAGDTRAAAAQLRQRGLRVLALAEAGGSGLAREIDLAALTALRSVPNQALVFFFRQLAFMLRAGLPVLQALELAATQLSNARLKQVIRRMRADIEAGQPLSRAMSHHADVFSGLAVNLVVAGEATGDLAVIVDRLATHLEKKGRLHAQTLNAMIYPLVVVLAAIGVAVFLVTRIIPKFGQFLAAQGKPLPPSTQFLIELSEFAVSHGGAIVATLALLAAALFALYRTAFGRRALDTLLLRLPLIGPLLTTAAMAQLTWALAMLLKSGVTVYDALRICANLLYNRALSQRTRAAAALILNGRDLAGSLRDPLLPPLVVQMIAVGERTGTLDQVLQELGSYYEQTLENGIRRLSALIEPALILVIGSMVGFVYYAFFQAMFSLASQG